MPPSPLGIPTRDELLDLARQQALLIAVQERQLEALGARVLELEARLAGDSKNSSRPPSADGLGKPPTRSLRRKSGLGPGGQSGHRGSTLMQAEKPDEVRTHRPGRCAGCGQKLDQQAKVVSVQRRQVFELPVVKARVVEHRLVEIACDCGHATLAPAPAGVRAPVQYGPRLRSAVLYLYQGQFLSKGRTAQAAAELFGVPVSAGSVANFQKMADRQLDGFMEQVKASACSAGVLGADETGLRVAGRTGWLHVARDDKMTVMEVNPRRGATAMRQIGVLDKFKGILVRDALGSYDAVGERVADQLCGAHLARELMAVSEFLSAHPEYARPCGWDWAEQAAKGLWGIKQGRDQAEDRVCPPDVFERGRHLMVSAGLIAAKGGCSPPGPLGDKHLALARRIAARVDEYLLFAANPKVPFDNNGSERDLRMAKLRMKVSGGFRTMTGAQQFARLRSYLSTTAKNNVAGYDAMIRLFTGHPWLPATT